MTTSAKIVADSLGAAGARITTFEVVVPRFILAEIGTHRMISKSAASSRAIPVATRIGMVEREPFVPLAFGKNRPGMQADENLDDTQARMARVVWEDSAARMVQSAKALAELGVHKQLSNRILEPFAFVNVVLTGTEFGWFFKLRNHPDAQPEFRDVAALMQEAYEGNSPDPVNATRLHLPYVTQDDVAAFPTASAEDQDALVSISAARCARVSYKTHDGRVTTFDEDRALCSRLVQQGHLSPFDHPAIADTLIERRAIQAGQDGDDRNVRQFFWRSPADHRQFWGWVPARVEVERRLGIVCGRNSYAPIDASLVSGLQMEVA